ncbi:hypothetical protein [Arthrobacter sp. zg-Y769]|uniref:hypothetical protein n=1 Tax=Arthrobacter sp. zg-Y769 TaxID=2894191 RepID=UPI001E52BBB9|nr:hypothetical protein [Arthrobacter sp. zg-Y769]MCC9204948.1 hypothetical protein [Arthrobacter sp. zg-Y769]
MLAGVIATIFAGALTIGLIALILYVKALRKVDKGHPDRKSQVQFNRRGFYAVVAFIACIAVVFWVALLLASNSDLPTWVFSIGFIFVVSAARPVLVGKYGEMFQANGEGKHPNVGQVPAAPVAPQYPGMYNAPAGPAAPAAPGQYGAPAAPGQYNAPGAGTTDTGTGYPGK